MIRHSRRAFLTRTLALSAAVGLAPAGWRHVFAATSDIGESPYGPLGDPDANGVRLPAGFSARLLGMTGEVVSGTNYAWHGAPDGGSTFAAPDGGWVYTSNSELNGTRGGVSAIRFDAVGEVIDAYRILARTKWNCAGGATPWGTWLSCEEHRSGFVWECNPFAPGQGIARPGLGRFAHEAAAVDPNTGYVYLTEDNHHSRLYRFRPDSFGDLSAGTLEAASVDSQGYVTWVTVPNDRPYRGRDTSVFNRGEGAWFDGGHLYFCTTADDRVWALDVASSHIDVTYDAALLGADAPLHSPDNVTVHARSGDIFVAEDGDDLQLVLLADQSGQRIAAPFLQFVGHDGSEVTGPAFNPDGTRLYVSSQRGTGGGNNAPGMTFEIRGPFRDGVAR
jgi:secreted PhoX family phosphatase